MLTTNKLIKYVGINLIIINVIWSGFISEYINRKPDLYFNFYNYKCKFSLTDFLPWFQTIITFKIFFDIKNA